MANNLPIIETMINDHFSSVTFVSFLSNKKLKMILTDDFCDACIANRSEIFVLFRSTFRRILC